MEEINTPTTGSNGNWLLTKDLEQAIRSTYVQLSKDVVEEDQYLTILRHKEYNEEQFQWLEETFLPKYFQLIQTNDD